MTPKPEHTELDEALNGYGAHLTGYDLAPEMDLETAKTAILQHYVPRTEVERLLQEHGLMARETRVDAHAEEMSRKAQSYDHTNLDHGKPYRYHKGGDHRKLKENGWEYKSYENACEQLERDGLLVHNGYKYGSAWKSEEVPADVLKELKEMKS